MAKRDDEFDAGGEAAGNGESSPFEGDQHPAQDPFYEAAMGANEPPPIHGGGSGVPQPPVELLDEHEAELNAVDPDETLAERGRLVWQWYKVFAACMAVMCLFTLLTGIATVTDPHAFPQVVQFQNFVSGWSMVLLSLVGIVAYAAAPIVLPETQWAWAVHLVLISVATITCCCAPISFPLVIMWCSPAVRGLFVD